MKKIAVLGAGGHGRVVADIAKSCGFEHVDFFDDDAESMYPSFSPTNNLNEIQAKFKEYVGIVVAIGNNEKRSELYPLIPTDKRISLIHPSAYIGDSVKIGCGSIVMANAVINTNTHVGEGAIINTASVIEHDCSIGDFCHISPGCVVLGQVDIGKYSWIGANSTIKQSISIGSRVIIGCGSVVVSDVSSNVKLVGNPANRRLE